LAFFLATQAITEMQGWKYIGSGTTATNTISVSGTGEVFAVPDIAKFSLTVLEEAKDAQSAQEVATKKINDITAYLRGEGKIAEKDIKTTDYSIGPKYEWIQATCTRDYCPPGEQKLVGYQVSQTIEVKVRDTEKAGDILSAAGSRGVSSISGLEFTVDDDEALKDDAREMAIEDAREKAEALANDLGVTLVRVVGFSEDGGGYPVPMYGREKLMSMDSVSGAVAAPELTVGENKIQSSVSVIYEIK
jgi:uncharacterized protein YggE